jgi:Trypsin-like peptidase domain
MSDSQIERNSQANTDAQHPSPFDAYEIFKQSSRGVVQVPVYNNNTEFPWSLINPRKEIAKGSGAFVQTDIPNSCEFVTGWHVTHAPQASVRLPDGKEYPAKANVLDEKHGLSFYEVEGVNDPANTCRALPIRETPPTTGEPVIAIGAAGTDTNISATNPAYASGLIAGDLTKAEVYRMRYGDEAESALRAGGEREMSWDDPMIVGFNVNGIGRPGFSGGPWVDRSGSLIGIQYSSDGKLLDAAERAEFVRRDIKRLNQYYDDNGLAPRVPITIKED